jgi:hypothetical protein
VNYEEVLIWTETLLIALAQYFRHGVLFPQSDDHFEVKKAPVLLFRAECGSGRVWIGPRVDRAACGSGT